jgi:hypothetical protein
MVLNDRLEIKGRSFIGNLPFVTYSASVTAAAGCFVLLLAVFVLLKMHFEPINASAFAGVAAHYALMELVLFFIGWVFAFVTALVPFIIGWAIAQRYKIHHSLFFIGGGCLTGMLLSPVSMLIPILGINMEGAELPFLQNILSVIPLFAICGAIAGITCWIRLRST